MQLQLLNRPAASTQHRRRNHNASRPNQVVVSARLTALCMKARLCSPTIVASTKRSVAPSTKVQAGRDATETTLSTEISSADKPVTWSGFKKALALSAGTAIGGAAVAMYINSASDTPCTVTGTCAQISDAMKVLLVGTHLYAFLLIPAAMYVFYSKIDELQDKRARSPFVALLGLSFMMVAIMGEIGWHIEQDWYYREEYNILNMAFYFFLNSGLSAWAFGLRLDSGNDTITSATPFLQQNTSEATRSQESKRQADAQQAQLNVGDAVDYFLLAAPALTIGLYALGAEVIDSKVPIYIMMSAIFAVLTYRFWQVLKSRKVLLFPFFSVGVNLGFIALLNKYQTDAFLNPLFHILHDAAGTLMGILIISVLTYMSPALAEAGEDGKAQS